MSTVQMMIIWRSDDSESQASHETFISHAHAICSRSSEDDTEGGR